MPGTNGIKANGTNPNDIKPNGINPNGINANSINTNGINANGIEPNGTKSNGINPKSINTNSMKPTTTTPPASAPLSSFQQRLWIHYERNPNDTSYNLPIPLLIRGPLDISALSQSINTIISRHEILRTTYTQTTDGEPLQLIAPPHNVPLDVIPLPSGQTSPEFLSHLDAFLSHRFNLRHGPIFIARLLHFSTTHNLLLLSVHHIAADAWSLKTILKTELLSAYSAFSRGKQPTSLPHLPLQYQDFARTQRESDFSTDVKHWTQVLTNYEDTLELPTTHPRQLKSCTRSGTLLHHYPPEFARKLDRLSRENGSTIFMCLLAALGLTLARYADKTDLCIGTTTSNRPDVDLEPLIGFFVNILPLRLRIDEQSSVADLLQAVRTLVLDAFEHPVPFERILQATDAARRGSTNPLVPIVMRHQNFPDMSSLADALPEDVSFEYYPGPDEADEAVLKLLAREHVPARCEIEMSYSGGVNGLVVEVVYAADLYDRAAIERLLAHHQQVLEGMFGDTSRRVLDLPLLRECDIAELQERSDRVVMMEPPALSFLERFDQQVDQVPGAVACWDGRGSWTYLDISRRARGLAQALKARGTAPGDIVAVCLPRGGELIATLLGIWQAGAAYVPLDPAYPTTYSQLIIEDARPSIIVCDANHQALLGVDDSRCLRPQQVGDSRAALREQPVHTAHPDSLAYVMYTSGSTGTPKGVRVPHRQLNNWLGNLERILPFQAGEVIGQKTTSVFAVGVKEIFAGLLNGCPQVVIDDDTLRDVSAFVAALAKHQVSRLNILPSHLASVIQHLKSSGEQLPSLKFCTTAGEPLPKATVLAFREMFPTARLFNNLGCTEVNDITYYDTANFDGTTDFVPVGTPIANTKVYVLDRHGRLVPDGVPGELHVASVSLPDGYHNLDTLTAERFLPNPFGATPSARLYNTGDVVRYLPDGNLDYMGRWDFQAKVRGFRIDVRQVEQAMGDFEGIRARAVVGQDDRLVAFYTSSSPHQLADLQMLPALRSFLRERLPAYMVPDAFVLLDKMPQLPNGKLNRRALLLLETQGELVQSGRYEAPATATERALADIWGVVVNVPAARIGRQTHFFEIGGHSLAAMRVLARIKDAFKVGLGLSELFDSPRLESIAALIDTKIGPKLNGDAGTTRKRKRQDESTAGLLQDKVVLVTGGSRGIGLHTALLLADQGAKVAINYRESEAQARAGKQAILSNGGSAEIFQADVTSASEVSAMIRAIHAHFGPIDVLVANAHINFRHRPFLDYSFPDLERKVTDELKALFYPVQAVIPDMAARREGGSIIAVSSTLSKRSTEGFLAQSTAKGAVDAFVRSLAAELGPKGIRVNTVAPGLTLTDAAMPMAPIVKESIAAQCPLRRNALPEDMAGAVVFLASDLARFMTGTYLPVDGGFTTL